MQNQLNQLVAEWVEAKRKYQVAKQHAITSAFKMTYLAKVGAAKRKLRREMDRVEKQVYGGLREEVL
jgi:hypothetical protein